MDSSPPTPPRALEPSLPSTAGVKRSAASLLPPFEPLSSSPGGYLPRPSKRQATAAASARVSASSKYPTPVPTSSTGILSSSPTRAAAARAALESSSGPAFGASALEVGLGLGLSSGLPGSSSRGGRGGGGVPPPLQRTRTQSIVSEPRAPLSDVRSVMLSAAGETLAMGRSSSSSDYQLSANRLISRVHVEARYVPAISARADSEDSDGENASFHQQGKRSARIEITCTGWNGLKLHCQGRTCELVKGQTFTSEAEGAEVMIDVLDTRVLVQWPRLRHGRKVVVENNNSVNALLGSPGGESSWDESPRRAGNGAPRSPSGRPRRIGSPESPTPGSRPHRALATVSASSPSGSLADLMPNGNQGDTVEIYEDEPDDQELPNLSDLQGHEVSFAATQVAQSQSFSSELSDPGSEDDLDDLENNPDEENDPIVHSFGPFGANLTNHLASISTTSPERPQISRNTLSGSDDSAHTAKHGNRSRPRKLRQDKQPQRISTGAAAGPSAEEGDDDSAAEGGAQTPTPTTPTAIPAASPLALIPLSPARIETLSNHIINQLAYSRLSSNPLTGLMQNLPEAVRAGLGKDVLRQVMEATACVGVIRRQGKDAAGKPLESEYYYVPELDTDVTRQMAVTEGLRKPSLRNCRKQHKQYYWKKPRAL